MLIRVRCPAGTWRFDGFGDGDLLSTLMDRIEEEKKIPVDAMTMSIDPAGSKVLDGASSFKAQGLTHGAMVHLKYGDKEPSTAGPKVISADGNIEKSFDQCKGFRPGMRSLRSIKMTWNMGDFMLMDAEFEYKVKRQEKGNCTAVALDSAMCAEFQNYMRQFAFSKCRGAFLYGKIVSEGVLDSKREDGGDEIFKVQVDCMFEMAQEGKAIGFDMFDDPLEEKADKIAEYLGLEKVGIIYAHPPRDENFQLTAAEILFACEQRVEVGKEKPFVIAKVTVDKEGQAQYEAYQVSDQCLEMYQAGALLEHEKPNYMAVHETYSAIVEAREVPMIANQFFLINVAVQQHTSDLTCDFPKANRDTALNRTALAAHLEDKGNKPFKERITDFQLLIFLSEFLDIGSEMPAICQAVANKDIPVEEGYQMIIESLCG